MSEIESDYTLHSYCGNIAAWPYIPTMCGHIIVLIHMFLLTSCILVSSHYCLRLTETSSTVRLQSTFPLSLEIFWIFARKVAQNVSAETVTVTVILAWCPMLPSGVYLTATRLSKIACLGDKISTSLWDFGRFNSLHELGLFIFLVTNDWSSGLCPAEILVFWPSQSFHFTRYSFSPFSPRSSCMSSTSHNF